MSLRKDQTGVMVASHDDHINHRVKHLDEHVLSLTKKVDIILIEASTSFPL